MKFRNKTPNKSNFTASLLETYPNLDNTDIDPETGAPIPSDASVAATKQWVEENEL